MKICVIGRSLQLGVFRLGLLENWDIWVGIFPEGQKILIRSARFDIIVRQRICAAKSQMRQRAGYEIHDHPRVIENLLKLGGGGRTLTRR